MIAAGSAALLFEPARAGSQPRLVATPRQTEGPFYPRQFPLDVDADLTQVAGRSQRAKGTITYLAGTLRSEDDRPVPGATIEIWQCDAGGVYHHVGDHSRGADPNFQGYGRTVTDGAGAFRFRTIKPVPYPGRTPHIHVIVAAPGMAKLTTQLYVAGEPLNERDGLLNAVRDPAARRSLLMELRPAPDLEAGALLGAPKLVLRTG
jgi:protocatechuate 3,4-dioxygenase beta subunit